MGSSLGVFLAKIAQFSGLCYTKTAIFLFSKNVLFHFPFSKIGFYFSIEKKSQEIKWNTQNSPINPRTVRSIF
jgi:hypothetical protein